MRKLENMDNILTGCDLCGLSHKTWECLCFDSSKIIEDRVVPSRARLTLPSQLCSIGCGRKDGVIALSLLAEGTQFGPYKAPKKAQLSELSCLPFKVFDTGENNASLFLDTSDEDFCNWMCLVRSSESYDKSNVMAFQVYGDIFFKAHKDISVGEELLVAYSPYYAGKMVIALGKESEDNEKTYLSVQAIEYTASDQVIQDSEKLTQDIQRGQTEWPLTNSSHTNSSQFHSDKSSSRPKRCSQRKRGSPSKFSDYRTCIRKGLVPDSQLCDVATMSIGLPTTKNRTCSQCSLKFQDEFKFACHFQEHFLPPRLASRNQRKDVSNTGSVSNDRPPLAKSKQNITKKPKQTRITSGNRDKPMVNVIHIKPCEVRVSRLHENIILESTGGSDNTTKDNVGITKDHSSSNHFIPEGMELMKQSNGKIIVNKCMTDKLNINTKKLVFSSKEYHLRDTTKANLFLEVDDSDQNLSENQNDHIYWSDSDSNAHSVKSEDLYFDTSASESTENTITSTQSFYCKPSDHDHLSSDFSAILSSQNSEIAQINNGKSVLHERFKKSSRERKLSKKKHKTGESETHIYECGICGSRFMTPFYLYRHTRKHTGDFSCVLCKKAFSRKESLLNHNCKRDKTRSCSVCGKSFSGVKRLEIHMRSHIRPFKCQDCERHFSSKHVMLTHACPQSKKKTPCPVCKKVYPNRHLMLKHIPVHTGQFSCPLCFRWLSTPLSAYNHIVLCSNIKEITDTDLGYKTCTNCGQVFSSIAEYRQHETSHVRSFVCKDCGARFHTSLNLHEHQCVGISLPCPYCGQTFDGIPSLQKHKCRRFKKPHQCMVCNCWFGSLVEQNEHSCPLDGLALNNGDASLLDISLKEPFLARDKFYICELCGNAFSSHSSLKAHQVIHGEKLFVCEVCGKRFHRKDQLIDHGSKHKEPSVPCPDCGKLFKSKKILLAHSRTHTSHKRFSCPICSKEFHQKGNLMKHQKTHDEDRNYECEDCGKTYRCHETYVKHKQVHINGKPISCSLCDKKFAKTFQLKHHLRDQHSGQLYRCQYCGITTKMRHSIIRHLKRKHSNLSSEWMKPEVVTSMHSLNNKVQDLPASRKRKSASLDRAEIQTDEEDCNEIDKSVIEGLNIPPGKTNLINDDDPNAEEGLDAQRLKKQRTLPSEKEDSNLSLEIDLPADNPEFEREQTFQMKNLSDQHSGQLYRCQYCGITTKMRHSLIHHLKRKHSNLKSEWMKPEVVTSMHSLNNKVEDLPASHCKHKSFSVDRADEIQMDEDSNEIDESAMGDLKIPLVKANLMNDDNPNPEQGLDVQHLQKQRTLPSEKEDNIMSLEMDFPTDNPEFQKEQMESAYGQVEVEQTEYHFLQGDEHSDMCDDSLQHQVVISDNMVLNDQQIEELSLKLQQEHTGTFVLEDGTIIQQQEQEGSNDLLFYVIAASEMQAV